MYEMQGPHPALRRWLTDCSAARRYLADHCYQIPARSAGCPIPQPFPEFPPELVPGPDTRPGRRSPGSPAVLEWPEIDICSDTRPRFRLPEFPAVSRSCPQERYPFRYPPEVPVARPLSRSRSSPRDRYPSLVVKEFLPPQPHRAQGFSGSNFKILWSSTGHPRLSPGTSGISTELSTDSSTASGISGLRGPQT
jgi:hypothetical protein